MARAQRWLIATAWCTVWVLLLAGPARPDAITIGPYAADYGDSQVFGYSTSSPVVNIGASTSRVAVEYDSEAKPLLEVFQVTRSKYHHLHITQYWIISGDETAYDWIAKLMVSDGAGGWTASGNYDDLWFSAKASVTAWPTTDPVATAILIQNLPDDVLLISWAAGLTVGTELMVEWWVTVPAGMTEFAIYQYTDSVGMGVPEPATMSLIGLGLGVLLVQRIKRR